MNAQERIKIENDVLEDWEKSWPFGFSKKSNAGVFSIDTPPPYINAELHVGHAAAYTYIDTVARVKRALGFNVLFPFGLDKNGLPIEVQAEKEFGVDIRKTPREEYVEACRNLLDKYRDKNKNVFKRLGFSFNSYTVTGELGGAYETDSQEYRAFGQSIFIKLWKEGKIYEDTQLVNYCTACHTTLSDAEVEYEEKDSKLFTISVKIDGKMLDIATTRPELIPACAALCVNPADNRYTGLNKAIMPVTGVEVPVIRDESIDLNFGTGVMMICSYGDKRDAELFKKYNLKEKIIIDENGKMQDSGDYTGLSVSKAREKIVDDLKKGGHLIKEEVIKTEKPICWRSKNAVELIREKELYLKQKELKDMLTELSGSMEFYKKESRQILLDWIKSIDRDWPISRTRYYGTEIPLWKCKDCGEYVAPEPGRYYQPWKETPKDLGCGKCGSKKLTGETRIFDTWMDSSNSNLFILGYGKDSKFFEKNFPTSIRPQGKEIIRTWLFYTMLKSYQLTGKKPFNEVLITNHAIDEFGEKFSKSKGNGILIEKALKENGGDVIRLWAYLGGNLVEGDIRYSKEKINEAERIINKISNIAKFISQFGKDQTTQPNKIDGFDEVFIKEFNRIYNNILIQYNQYDFFKALREIKNFVINIFADHYLELRKSSAYDGDKSAIFTLNHILMNTLELLNPIAPFFTQHIYQGLYSKDIKQSIFSNKLDTQDFSELIQSIGDFDSTVWTTKKSSGIPLNGEISGIAIPADLQNYKDVFIKAHKIKI